MQEGVEEMGDKFEEVMGEPSTEPLATPKRTCPRRPERSRNLRHLGETLVEPRRNLGGTFRGTLSSLRQICPREPEKPRNLKNLGGTVVHPYWNLGGTFWRPKTDLPQRTIESPEFILRDPNIVKLSNQ